MTLFEYLSVAVSIVLSLSAAQILTNLRAVFDPERRYWVHCVWVAVVLFTHLLIWWGFWAFRAVDSWNLATFSLVLTNPGVLFVASITLVVDGSKAEAAWEEHFFRIRRSFFVIFGMVPSVSVLRDWVLLDTPILHLSHLPEGVVTSVCIVGWLSGNRRTHTVLAAVVILVLFTAAAQIWLQPGGGREILN